jgi:protein gp37
MSIPWTEETWNPVVGCSKISDGCRECYAIREAWRLAHNPNPKISTVYKDLVQVEGGRPNWTGVVRLIPWRLSIPFAWKQPRLVFVNSMSDLFHELLPSMDIAEVWRVMHRTPRHTYQILTKRADRLFDELPQLIQVWGVLPNVWLGISAEDQASFDQRWAYLRYCQAAVQFISYEPALGPLKLPADFLSRGRYAWVIAGGETGSKKQARESNRNWYRDVYGQCKEAGVPFFMKQITEGGYPLPWNAWRSDLQVRELPEITRSAAA